MAILASGLAFGQTIPNGGFENWTSTQYEEPTYYQTSNSSNNNGVQNPDNTIKTTDAYHGVYAIQLNTILINNDTSFAFFANGDPGQSPPAGGLPYAEKPTGLRLYYKSNIVGTDSAIIVVMFKKAGASIGNYFYKIGASKTAYTLFNPTFSPALTVTPDTVVFASASSNAFIGKGTPGNMLQLDSISFTGVAQQPVNFNGDLELWQSHTVNNINNWTLNDGGTGVTQTTDKYSGTYAIELSTTGPSFGGSNQVQPGNVITGTSVRNASPRGGHPYSNQIDTLVFYYKYIPADPNDSGYVSVNFSKNAVNMGGFQKKLGTAVGNYVKVMVPFNLAQAPDTSMVTIQSSWAQTWPYPNSYVGSDLKVDNMYLTSQEKPVTNFSLPASGCLGQAIQLTDSSLNTVTGWTWVVGGGTLSAPGTENPTVTYTTVGSHTVSMIATNSFGSGNQVFKHITIYALPSIGVTSPSVCEGHQAIVMANGALTYTWSTSATTASISVTPTTTTVYTVTGTDVNGCSNTSQTSVTILTAPTPNICMVTVDSLSQFNIVYWDKTSYANVDSFVVYREVQSAPSTYLRIGAQTFATFSQFIDTTRHVGPANGDPNTGSYRYKLQTVDTCGNYSALSPYHNTIYIAHNSSGVFSWATPYQIEGASSPVQNYYLFCDTNNTNFWKPVASVAGNQQQVVDPGYSNHSNIANWRVDATGFNCNPTLRLANGNNSVDVAKVKSHSNQNNNRVSGISKIANTNSVNIYPNPATNALNINFASAVNKASVKIYSVIGSEVLSTTASGTNTLIDISNLASGAYMVQITTDNVVETKKIVKQ